MNSKYSENQSRIVSFYKDKSIFITGATGFLGKILIEKLLRSCYDLKSIYILVRSKKGKDPFERIEELLSNNKLFQNVEDFHSDFRKKLIAVQGDLSQPKLGLSDQDYQHLVENIDIVFHSAATVRFDEPLKVAVNINVVGTKKVLELAKNMKKLQAFIHVSTAYANCDKKYVTEEVFKPPVAPDKIMEAVDWIDDDVLKLICSDVIKPRPNTYTYTKAIAEYLVLQESSQIPSAIIRPSIVGASWIEPFPGWVDNYNGPTGLIEAQSVGALRCMLGIKEATADIIPVDVVINMIIAAAWHIGTKKIQKLIVYNCTSDLSNKCSWDMVQNFSNEFSIEIPTKNTFLYPHFRFTTYSLMRLQLRIKNSVQTLEFFTCKNFEFSKSNFLLLIDEMNDADRQTFQFDTRNLDWKEYMKNYYIGIKRYLGKEEVTNLTTLEKNQKRLRKFKIVRIIGIFLSSIIILKLTILKSTSFKFLITFLFRILSDPFKKAKALKNLIAF